MTFPPTSLCHFLHLVGVPLWSQSRDGDHLHWACPALGFFEFHQRGRARRRVHWSIPDEMKHIERRHPTYMTLQKYDIPIIGAKSRFGVTRAMIVEICVDIKRFVSVSFLVVRSLDWFCSSSVKVGIGIISRCLGMTEKLCACSGWAIGIVICRGGIMANTVGLWELWRGKVTIQSIDRASTTTIERGCG